MWFKIFGICTASRMFLNGLIIHRNADGEYARFKDFIIKYPAEILIEYSVNYKEMFFAHNTKRDRTKTIHKLVQITSID